MKGGTEEEVKLKLIEATIANLWWVFQRHSPHATTGLFLREGWLELWDKEACQRCSLLILSRDAEIMRQMAKVIEDAINGNLTPVSGRREDLIPWQPHQL